MSVSMLSQSGGRSSSSASVGTDIVKQGYLYIKRPPQNGFLRFKSWHKRYFVLRDETTDHPSHLEMYEKEADFLKNSLRKFVLYLDNVIHVGRSSDSKRFTQAFMIVCSGRAPIILAEDDPLYANSWLLAVTLIGEKGRQSVGGCGTVPTGLADANLLRHGPARCSFPLTTSDYRRSPSGELQDFLDEVPLNACYSESLLEEITVKKYDVTIEATKASRRNNIEGDYQLVVRSWGLSLVRSGKEDYVVHWPLCFIRKFKSEFLPHASKKKSTLVTLELGRRCVTGEGVLQFRTRHGREIVADMNQAICNSMSNKLVLDTVAKGRPLFRSRSSNKETIRKSPLNSFGAWKSASSSRGSSLSRQSSSGTSRSLSGRSLIVDDSTLHVVDLRTANSNGNIAEKPRSPLRSDSSGDSKTIGDVSRVSISSLISSSSTSSSSSSSAEAGVVSLSNSVPSSESAEYIQAEFSSPKRFSSLKVSTSPSSRAKIFSCNSFPPHIQQNSNGEVIGAVGVSEMSKAEAEGYLEVLPDISVCGEGGDGYGNDMSNIYHIMDFSKRSRSSSPTNSKSVTGRSSRRSEHHISCRTLPLLEESISSLMFVDRNSLHRRSHCGLGSFASRKPPAPLPRPEHTIFP